MCALSRRFRVVPRVLDLPRPRMASPMGSKCKLAAMTIDRPALGYPDPIGTIDKYLAVCLIISMKPDQPVIIAEDDATLAILLQQSLESEGFSNVTIANSLQTFNEALDARGRQLGAVVLDGFFREAGGQMRQGAEFAKALREKGLLDRVGVIGYSGTALPPEALGLSKEEARHYVDLGKNRRTRGRRADPERIARALKNHTFTRGFVGVSEDDVEQDFS